MKRLYLLDLDGTTGLYHLFQQLGGRVILRPGMKEALALMGEAKRVIATRGEPEYARAVRRVLASQGIVFDAWYDRETVELVSPIEAAGYFKHYAPILAEHGIGERDQAVVIGDLMHFEPQQPFPVERFRRYKFARDPERPAREHACIDHPTTPRLLYVVLPQVLTYDEERVISLSLRPVVEHLERMWAKGRGDLLEGFRRLRRWDWTNEYVVSDALMRRMSFEVQVGQRVTTRAGEDVSALFLEPFPHHYLFFKGRRRDWLPADYVQAVLELEDRP